MLHEMWIAIEPCVAFAGGVVRCAEWAPVASLALLAPGRASPACAALVAGAREPPAGSSLTLDHVRRQTQYLALAVDAASPTSSGSVPVPASARATARAPPIEREAHGAALQIWSYGRPAHIASSIARTRASLLFTNQ